MKKTRFIILAIVIVLLAAVTIARFATVTHHRQTVTVSSDTTAPITYKGQNGKDALTLLKQQATVGQANSGLVTSINGVAADNAKRQYWAFYINGHLASIGPADYKTKDSDTITWRMEKY